MDNIKKLLFRCCKDGQHNLKSWLRRGGKAARGCKKDSL
jgi:hypothetical protein